MKMDFLQALKDMVDETADEWDEHEAKCKILLEILPAAPTILEDEKKLDMFRLYVSKALAKLARDE